MFKYLLPYSYYVTFATSLAYDSTSHTLLRNDGATKLDKIPSNEFKRKSFTSATLFEPQPAGYATSPRVNKMVAKDWSEPQIVNTEQQMHWRQQIVCK